MNRQTWPAPAKLNLFLHITGRRPDGYHELQTFFQIIDFGDELEFTLTDTDQIQLTGDNLGIETEQNLIYKAAFLLKEHKKTPKGIRISLHKRIPMGGGLGGGSSNAATTLVALGHIWNTGLSVNELTDLGLSLGADVPVFVNGCSAWAEGVGEKLQPVELPVVWYLVIYTGCHVDTGKIFKNPDLTRNTSPITMSDFKNGLGHNDFEAVVFGAYPEVAMANEWLGQWTRARMTGTGSCVFGQFETESKAREILNCIPENWQGFVSQGLNHSPLIHRVKNDDSF